MKPRIEEIIVVEGKYDAVKLASLVDALIIPTGGFSVFTSDETKNLILTLGKKRGIIVMTDSDSAGFRIRTYINKFASGINVKNAYVPSVQGKEKRKRAPGKEGLLGVEGVDDKMILKALDAVCATPKSERTGREITYTDLYILGLSGTQDSADFRRKWLSSIGLPQRISKKALCEVLNTIYTYEELTKSLKEFNADTDDE